MFVKFFGEKYLPGMDKYINDGNTCPPALCAGKTPDEKLKINKLEPYQAYDPQVLVTTCENKATSVFRAHEQPCTTSGEDVISVIF